jgi:hypothetical protein
MATLASLRIGLPLADSRRRIIRTAGIVIGGSALVFWFYALTRWFWDTAWLPVDSVSYLLAGVRLNSGGELYSLRATDFWWPWADPNLPPMYGPPLMGVVGRVIAAVGPEALLAWLLVVGACTIWAVLMILRMTDGWAGVFLFALAAPATLLVGVANADGVVMAALLLAWLLPGRIRGILIGFAVSLKLTPLTMVAWLLFGRQWQALRWFVITAVVLGLLVVVAIDPSIPIRYLSVMQQVAGAGRPAVLLFVVAGLILMYRLRHRPALTFAIAVVLIPLGSPQAAGHSWAMILVAAPAIWEELTGPRAASPSRVGRSLWGRNASEAPAGGQS